MQDHRTGMTHTFWRQVSSAFASTALRMFLTSSAEGLHPGRGLESFQPADTNKTHADTSPWLNQEIAIARSSHECGNNCPGLPLPSQPHTRHCAPGTTIQGPTAVASTETLSCAHTIRNNRQLCRSTCYLLLPPSTQSMYAATCFIAARKAAREGGKKG